MPESQQPRLEPLRDTGRSARRAGVAVGAVLVLLVGVASTSRLGANGPSRVTGAEADDSPASNSGAANQQPAADTELADTGFRVVAPQEGRRQRNDGRIRIAARGAEPHQVVRASVMSGPSDLGIATMQSDTRGVIEDSVHLAPIARTTHAQLYLHDAVRGNLLANLTITLDPGFPVSVMSPSGSRGRPAGDRLSVFGMTLTDVKTVTVRLLERHDVVVAERTLSATGSHPRWRAFAAEFLVPLERQPQLFWLDVTWTGGPSEFARRHLRIPVWARSSREGP